MAALYKKANDPSAYHRENEWVITGVLYMSEG
jgi:hypothetical protein